MLNFFLEIRIFNRQSRICVENCSRSMVTRINLNSNIRSFDNFDQNENVDFFELPGSWNNFRHRFMILIKKYILLDQNLAALSLFKKNVFF